MRNDLGFLAGEIGVVNGRQNWKDNNSDKSVIGALRWRSSDMQTWMNYSFMRGNEQNEPGGAVQAPISRVISPRGQMRPVERRSKITPAEFQAIVEESRPVVLEGFARDWPAIARWSPKVLGDRYGDDVVVLSDKDAGDGVYNKVGGKAMKLPLREVVERLYAGRRVNQTFDSIIHRHPELGDDFHFDRFKALLPPGTKTGIRDSFSFHARAAWASPVVAARLPRGGRACAAASTRTLR